MKADGHERPASHFTSGRSAGILRVVMLAVVVAVGAGGLSNASAEPATSSVSPTLVLGLESIAPSGSTAADTLGALGEESINTTLTIEPALPTGNAGWYVGQPQISFVSSEPGLTYFSWSSPTGPWSVFAAPVVASLDGTQTIYYYSADLLGNVEPVRYMTAKYDMTPPSTPSTPAADAQSATESVLTWDTSDDLASGVDYYEVRNYGSLLGTSPVNSMALSSLATETAYSFSVAAVDVAGNVSAESGSVAISTLSESARPPQVVYVADAGTRGPVVNWSESTGTVPPVRYRVWRSVAGAPAAAIATIAPDADRSFADTTAPRRTELSYGISAVDARGEGAVSAPTATTVVTPWALPAPTGLTARNTASVTLTWAPSPLAASYHVFRATGSASVATTLTSTPVTSPAYRDATTAARTEYWYSVATVDASGNVGPPSSRVYIRTATDTATVGSPHGAYGTDTEMCAACHQAHGATGKNLLVGTTTTDAPLCLSCHDGTSASDIMSDFTDMSRSSRHPVSADGSTGTLECSSCHLVHAADQTATVEGMLRVGSEPGNSFCYTCHGAPQDAPRGDLRVFEQSAHGASVVEPPTGTKVVCLSCHVGHSSREDALYPYSGDDRCLGCHASSGQAGGSADIASRLSGDGPGTRHDLKAEDGSATGSRLSCANCHEPHTSSAATPCVDPDSPTTADPLQASGVTLCLRCHDDSLPTSEDTSGWAQAPLGVGGSATTTNIKDVWDSNVHGGGESDSPALNSALAYQEGDVLACESCHDAHGSTNRFALRETVAGTRTANVADNLAVASVPGGGWDLRFFCDSCHEINAASHPAADISAWPVDCTSSGCHTHAANGL